MITKPFNKTIYYNNLIDLETIHADLEATFEDRDEWVNFINDLM